MSYIIDVVAQNGMYVAIVTSWRDLLKQTIADNSKANFALSTARTGDPLKIENADKENAWFIVSSKYGRLGTIHIVLAITDNGTPAFTRYVRFIINV